MQSPTLQRGDQHPLHSLTPGFASHTSMTDLAALPLWSFQLVWSASGPRESTKHSETTRGDAKLFSLCHKGSSMNPQPSESSPIGFLNRVPLVRFQPRALLMTLTHRAATPRTDSRHSCRNCMVTDACPLQNAVR